MIRTIIVDDEPNTEKIIRFFVDRETLPLEIIGSADNGRKAVGLIKKLEPDLVFLDIQMPEMTGLEVIAELPDYKYVVVTAFDDFSYAQQALRLGAADILLKPIELAQLEQAVARATGWQITDNRTVNEIIEYIQSHYAEKIGLASIAQEFFLTSSHVARLFKKHFDDSVGNYINRVRIDNARRLLEEGESVKAAAEMVGYDSLNNFYKHFKRYTGHTPAAYSQRKKSGQQGKDDPAGIE